MKFYSTIIFFSINIFASGSLLSKNERDANGFIGQFDDVKTGVRVTDVTPFKTFRTKSARRCMEHCLQHAQCKSTNMNEELGHCELLSISLNHDPSIGTTEENGWFYQGFIQNIHFSHQQQDTITAEEKEMCYQDQPDPDNLPEENYCVESFFFDGKLHRSCSPQCQSLERIMVPLPPNTPTVCVTGSSESNHGHSCRDVKKKCRRVRSGNYWVSMKPTMKRLCYCDMETDGGGWLLAGHVNITSESQTSKTADNMKIHYSQMESVTKRENKLLRGERIEKMYDFYDMKDIRIQCTKPWHERTVDIIISKGSKRGPEFFNYFGMLADSISGFCPKPFRVLPDDTSFISRASCDSYSWSYTKSQMRLHLAWMYVPSKYHVMVGYSGRRYECDDFQSDPGFSSIGVWNYYLR